MTKWVYSFGAERAEGRGGDEEPARRQGRQPARDGLISACPCLPASPSPPRSAPTSTPTARPTRPISRRRSTRRWRRSARQTGHVFGDAANPLLALGALGRARVDARHDGHRPQPRPQRRRGRDAREDVGRRALRLRQLSPLHPDVFERRARRRQSTISRTSSSTTRTARATRSTPTSRPTTGARSSSTTRPRSQEATGKPFPQEPKDQLWGAIGAVFSSWMNQRAITYRRLNGIPADWGTAVNVQAMVFGNMGETSATGVAFTRNPSTGENALYGEFLVNAQGEDVVAGIRTPQNITEAARKAAGSDKPSLEALMPDGVQPVRRHDATAREALPRHAGPGVHRRARQALDAADPQRQAHRASAALQGRGRDGQRGPHLARGRDHPRRAERARPAPAPDARPEGEARSRSRPACRLRRARRAARSCSPPTTPRLRRRPDARSILVRVETSPEDIHGMHAAEGILTTRGGMTSHAAVVARGMGKPCVSGAGSIRIDYAKQTMTAGGVTLKKGDILTIDGARRRGDGGRRCRWSSRR